MRQTTLGVVAAVLTLAFCGAGCADPGDRAATETGATSQALVHTFDCTGPTPNEYGYADAHSTPLNGGFCVRVRGDVNRGSAGLGFIYAAPWPIRSIQLSTVNTSVQACKGQAIGPTYSPCNGDINTKWASSSGSITQLPNIAWPPVGAGSPVMVVGFLPQAPPPLCPYVNGPYAHPSFCDVCGTYSPSGMPNRVCHGVADPGSPIVLDIHTGDPCTCPADAVVPAASQCNAVCP